MKKEVFNQIVVDNIDSKLISVILSSGIKLSQELRSKVIVPLVLRLSLLRSRIRMSGSVSIQM